MLAYAPQSGETEKIKEAFLRNWGDLMSRVPRTETIVIGANINGNVGGNLGVFQRVHGGKGYGQRNREGNFFSIIRVEGTTHKFISS